MTSEASHGIGWIGLGRIGQAMAARLVRTSAIHSGMLRKAAMTDNAG
jgi:3-hydroxyisobutyrate dehydrogenase-like beta-hydroxyacid dehydrogenase